jgi:hypothetical protein
MPRFHNEEARTFEVLKPDDYALTVFEFSTGLSTGEKTKNSECYDIVFKVEGHDGARVYEKLIDHPTTLWKVNLFIKACGIVLEENEDYHFEQHIAEKLGYAWINPMGLRCWATLGVRSYPGRSGRDIEVNNIATYIVDPKKGFLKTDPELRNKPTKTPRTTPPPTPPLSPFATGRPPF